MNDLCRICGKFIEMRMVGPTKVWMHRKPSINHAALPQAKS